MDDFSMLDTMAQAELVRRGEVSPLELVEAAIRRIERENPRVNAVVTDTFERARAQAGGSLPGGPFRGVPFLLKDLHAADAGVRMTMGSRLLKDYVPDYDSEMVTRFKRAGFVILGRTNTPEFGIPPTTEPTFLGPCRNPWNVEHSPGGSSGGAAAAVATRMVPAAHATDAGGSIRIPASCCGVFGLKPTRARNPVAPKMGESVGAMGVEFVVSVSVRDSAALLDVTNGPALGDPYWAPPPPKSYLAQIERPPAPLRIAVMPVPMNGAPVHDDCRKAVEVAATLCADAGHDVVEDALTLPMDEFIANFLTVWTVGAAVSVENASRIAGRKPGPDDVEPLTTALAGLGRSYGAVDYLMAQRALHRASRDVARFFEQYDILLTPTLARPPVRLGDLACPPDQPLRGFFASGGYAAFTALFNVTGQPAMSVPLHWNEAGLPIGTQFVARFGDEETLLRLARQLEQMKPWAARRPEKAGS